MMRKLLEAMTKFAGEPEQKPGEQWKGTDKGTPGKKLVGDSIIKDLSKGVTPKTKEEELAEAFANFNEDDLGVEEKRPGRKSDRPSREYTKNGKPSKRYTPVKEGWMNGSDRVNLPDGPMTYWNGTGRLQNEYNELYEKLVPSQGAAETIEGEVLRASSKIVYRHFNDGDLFNQASFDQLKQYIGTVTDYDDLAEKAIEFALKAQGNYHPNTGWDSLDVMDYGPTDDDNGWDEEDEYDDEDDTNWEEEDDELEESADVVARYADDRARGTGFVYNVDATGQITSSGNIRHNKKFSTPEKAMAYLDKCGFTKKGELEEGMEEFAKSQAKKRAEKRKSIPWPKEVPSDAEQERNRTRDEEENDPHPYTQVGEAKWRENPDAYSSELDDEGNEYKKSKGDVGRDLLKKDKLGYTRPGNANVVSKGARTGKATQSHINQLKGNIKHSLANHGKANLPEGEHDAEFIDHEDNWYNMADWARAEFKKGKSVEEVIKYLRDNDYLGPRDINNFMKTVSGEKWNESVEEGKHFRTTYGWAGGRNEKTGKMYKHPDQIKADREAKKAATAQQSKDAFNDMFGGDAEDLTQNLKIKEAGMPSSVIKHKQALASKTPEALYAGFKQVADKQGKSVESLARSAAWRHGYGKGNGQGSAHYWDKIKHLGETVSEADMFKAGQRAIKNIKSATQQRKSEAEKMAIAQAQIDADRENERDRFSQEELYPSDDSHDVDEGWEADLAKTNRERMKKERAAAKPMKPIAKAKPDYSRVFQDINSAIGDTFPDGDPMDALMRKYRDSYGDLNIDLLNKACRVNGAKSYHDYVAKVWQQHMQDNPDLVQGGNPWVAEGLGKDIKRLATGKDVKSRAGQEIAKSQDAIMKGDTKTSKKHFDRFVKLDKLANKEQGVAEGEVSTRKYEMMLRNGQVKKFVAKDDADAKRIAAGHGAKSVIRMKGNVPGNKIAENDHPQHSVDRYNKDLERKIDKDFDPDYDRTMSDQEFEAKLKQRGKERDKGVAEGLGNLKNIGDLVKQSHDKIRASIQSKVGMTQDQINDAGAKKIKAKWKNIGDEIIKSRLGEAPQGVAEATGDTKFDNMLGNITKPSAVQALSREEKVHELIRQYFWHKRRADMGSAVTHEHGHDRMAQKVLLALKKMNIDLSTIDPLKLKAIKGEVYEQGVAEGWESGPDEPRTQERDPDADYRARRQEKLDAEADKAPKTTTYQCVGRGPNDEPNYKFGPEHNTSEEAVAYRKKLMANPKTPNPRDIGIRTISKVAKGINEDVTSTDPLEGALLDAIHELIGQGHTDVDPMVLTNMVVAATSQPFLLKDLVDANNNSQAVQHYIDSISPSKVKFSSDMLTVKNEDPAKDKAKAQAGVSSMASRAANRNRLGEGTETPLQNKEDYNAKRKALQDIQLDPDTAKDPQLKAEVIRRLASLNQQYSMLREQISKFKESRGHKVIATKLGNMDRMQNVQVPSPAERREQLRIAKEKEQAGKKQVKEFAAPGMNPATPVATNTAAKPDPATVAKAAAATNTLKAATGTVVAPATLDKALDSATQGTATSTDVKALAPIMGVVNKAASDPKLAAQFKNLANQAKTTP